MGQDAFGNYVASFSTDTPSVPAVGGFEAALSGTGSPEGVVPGVKGNLYVDLNTGGLYVKTTNTGNTGWVAVSGGGGGSQEVFSGHGSPVGVVAPTTTEAVYFDLDTGDQWDFYGSAWH